MKDINTNDINTITLVEAQTRIAAWQEDQRLIKGALPPSKGHSPALDIKAFTFDLKEMFEMCLRIYNHNSPGREIYVNIEDISDSPLNAIRFYLGKNEPTAQNSPACLIAVAVKDFATDNANPELRGGEDFLELPSIKPPIVSSIYDFSFPCPMTCANPTKGIMDQN
jgi:hypothetical protein